MPSLDPTVVVLTLVAVFIGSRVANYYRYAKVRVHSFSFRATLILQQQTGYLPGLRSLATPISLFGAAFPTGRLNPGMNWQWEWRKDGTPHLPLRSRLRSHDCVSSLVYARYGTETISALPWLFGEPAIYTSSIEVARQIVSTRNPLFKSPDITAVTTYATSALSS